jgi:hypothetical protein
MVYPFQANTAADPSRTIAAAAWSYVLKILQEHHLISAPKYFKVSIRTAV